MSKPGSQSIREIVLRARWTIEDAKTVFAAWEESKLSAIEFAGKHGFDPQRLYWWRRRLGAASTGAVDRVVFEEVIIPPAASPAEHDSRFEIVLVGGVVVRVPSLFDDHTLRRVLKAVGEAGSC